jgi:UDP-N-acetyl-D-glucosamine dehydrogenase
VPTPLSKNLKPDLSYLKKTIKSISPFINSKKLISLESTSYPGTTYEELVSKFKLKFNIGKNLFICYSPEREDPGNKQYKTIDVPKVISGHTKNCLEVGKVFYSSIFKKLEPVSSTSTAEFTKLLENIYRAVNIGLVNEMKIIADLMKLDIYEIIKAASTKPFGFKAFYPGPGTGGHCIPIDPFYMSWKAKKLGYDSRFIKSSGIINTKMSTWIVNKVVKVLKIKKVDLVKSKILILGIAYKKNVDDIRESPAFPIIQKLQMKKIKISYHDPYVPELYKSRHYNFKLKSIKLSKKNMKKFSAVIIVTDHDNIKYSLIEKNSKIIFDCRGRLLPKNNYSKSKIYTV